MAAEWLTCAILIAILTAAFGHFETVRPLWTRITRCYSLPTAADRERAISSLPIDR